MKRKMNEIIKKIVPEYFLLIIRAVFFPKRLVVLTPTFNFDGLATVHEVDFMDDERFLNALQAGKQYTPNRDDYYRLYLGCALADHAAKLDGDFVECGVWLGTLSKTIITYVQFNDLNKKFYLIDTYEGIPKDRIIESDGRHEFIYGDTGVIEGQDGNKSISEKPRIIDLVKQKFKDDQVEIAQGIIPDIFTTLSIDKISFLHVDMNNAYPEVEAIRFFWDKLVTGGVILLDDYALSKQFALQKQMIDDLGRDLNFSVINLPTGQGLILKH